MTNKWETHQHVSQYWQLFILLLTVCIFMQNEEAAPHIAWWRHQMETFSALLAICAGNSPVTGEFPTQRPVTRRFDAFFDLHPNERLSKQSWGWWFETLSSPLWRHRNGCGGCRFTCFETGLEKPMLPLNDLNGLQMFILSISNCKWH